MAAYDDVDVKRIFSVGILSIVVTAVTALAVQVVYYYMVQVQTSETAAASDYTRQNTILREQQAEISNYGVDPQSGNIVIPIKQAIDLMIEEATPATSEEKKESSEET